MTTSNIIENQPTELEQVENIAVLLTNGNVDDALITYVGLVISQQTTENVLSRGRFDSATREGISGFSLPQDIYGLDDIIHFCMVNQLASGAELPLTLNRQHLDTFIGRLAQAYDEQYRERENVIPNPYLPYQNSLERRWESLVAPYNRTTETSRTGIIEGDARHLLVRLLGLIEDTLQVNSLKKEDPYANRETQREALNQLHNALYEIGTRVVSALESGHAIRHLPFPRLEEASESPKKQSAPIFSNILGEALNEGRIEKPMSYINGQIWLSINLFLDTDNAWAIHNLLYLTKMYGLISLPAYNTLRAEAIAKVLSKYEVLDATQKNGFYTLFNNYGLLLRR
jgi:hypothetical protein